MTTQTKRTANEVASLFVEQAVRETKVYLARMRQAGDRHFLGAVYDTCIQGGINTELSPRQARWLASLMQHEGDTCECQVNSSGHIVGTWLYHRWVDRRSRTRHRIIYTLNPQFAATSLGIDAATMHRAMAYGQVQRA